MPPNFHRHKTSETAECWDQGFGFGDAFGLGFASSGLWQAEVPSDQEAVLIDSNWYTINYCRHRAKVKQYTTMPNWCRENPDCATNLVTDLTPTTGILLQCMDLWENPNPTSDSLIIAK